MKFHLKLMLFLLILLEFSCHRSAVHPSALVQLSIQTYSDELMVEGTVEAVSSTTLNCPQRIDGTIIYLVKDGNHVLKGDTVCILENREIKNYHETILSKVENTRAAYNKSKADLDMNYALLQAQLSSIEAQTSISNLDSIQMNYVSPVQKSIKELELKIAAIEKAKYERKLEFLKRINESELKKIQLQIKQDENQAEYIKSILDQMVMTAPLNGIALRANSMINRENKMQEGDQVWDGIPLVSIPDLLLMKVIILASETDYKRIAVNDSVIYTFDAMPGNMAWGKILQIAPMGRPISRNSKIKVFEITASVDSFKVLPEPGLSAMCRIIMNQLPNSVVVPQLAIYDEDSVKVVYVTKGKNFIEQEVLLGMSSPKEAVIVSGLTGNETLSFVKPSESNISSRITIADSVKQKLIRTKTDTLPVQQPNAFPNELGIETNEK